MEMERLKGKAPASAMAFAPATSFPPLDRDDQEAYEPGNQLLPAQEVPMDPKKLKRILASRQYSQRYRMKQLQYILQLEAEARALQAQVEIASPRIKYAGQQNSLLRAENCSIKHKLAAYMGELIFKQAQYEELKKEREHLLKCLHLSYDQAQGCPEYFGRISDGGFPLPAEVTDQ